MLLQVGTHSFFFLLVFYFRPEERQVCLKAYLPSVPPPIISGSSKRHYSVLNLSQRLPSSDTTINGSQAVLKQCFLRGWERTDTPKKPETWPFGKRWGVDVQAVNVLETSECFCLQPWLCTQLGAELPVLLASPCERRRKGCKHFLSCMCMWSGTGWGLGSAL